MTFTSTSLLPLYYTLIPAALSNLIHFHHLKHASPNPKIDFNYNLFLKRILMTRGEKQSELLCLFKFFSYKLGVVFSIIRSSSFFFNLTLPAPLHPSSFPSLLSLPTADPYPELTAHPSFSRHAPLPPQSSLSSPFCAFCFCFLVSFSSFFIIFSLADGLSSTFPVRYVCLLQTPRPPFLPLTS